MQANGYLGPQKIGSGTGCPRAKNGIRCFHSRQIFIVNIKSSYQSYPIALDKMWLFAVNVKLRVEDCSHTTSEGRRCNKCGKCSGCSGLQLAHSSGWPEKRTEPQRVSRSERGERPTNLNTNMLNRIREMHITEWWEIYFTKSEKYTLQNQTNTLYIIRKYT